MLERTTLVPKAEVAGGKPPLDGASEHRAPAPAAGIAAAHVAVRVVDPRNQAPARHVQDAIARLANPRVTRVLRAL